MKNRSFKLSQTGSLFNYLMSHNESVPKVGEGATILMWSDRHAYEVIEVDEKKKKVIIQRYAPARLDKLGMTDSQQYEYKELTDEVIELYYKWNSWKNPVKRVIFTDEAYKKYGYEDFGKKLHNAYKEAGGEYNDNGAFISSIIPDITKEIIEWHTVNIIFGVKREYYDYSF